MIIMFYGNSVFNDTLLGEMEEGVFGRPIIF